jgi:hypothetical protein
MPIERARAKVSDKGLETSNEAAAPNNKPRGVPTTTRRPSQSAVVNDWSLAGGLPGSTARIEAVGSEVGRSLRSGTRYTISSFKTRDFRNESSCRGKEGNKLSVWGGCLDTRRGRRRRSITLPIHSALECDDSRSHLQLEYQSCCLFGVFS